MKKIKLTQGQFTLVDDEDYNELNKYKWYANYDNHIKGYYAKRNILKSNGKQISIRMHRVILNMPKVQVDHKNHDTLDNRKENLRLCTQNQNQYNQIRHKNTSSKYKGVSWFKQYKKWRVRITCQGKQIFLGYYKSEIQASKEYDKVARQLFGEFANLNFKENKNDR